MNIDSIRNGVVIDHISAGCGMRLYHLLGLETLDVSVAIIKNVSSRKLGKKDIIKIDAPIPVNLDVIGFVDPMATVNIIRDGKLIEKKSIEMPELLRNVIRCNIAKPRRNEKRVFCRRVLLVRYARVRAARRRWERYERVLRRQGSVARLRGCQTPAHRPPRNGPRGL